MGCASSRTAALDVYRAPPSSFAVFDVTAIEEPWAVKIKTDDDDADDDADDDDHLPSPPSILQKLRAIDGADEAPPPPWTQVSKELEDLKPNPTKPILKPKQVAENTSKKSDLSSPPIRTVEELEKKRVPATRAANDRSISAGKSSSPLKDNMFIVRDKLEREREGRARSLLVRSNPLTDFDEILPPGGEDAVVVYTTSLGGVRRTHEDCHRVRRILESHWVVYDERDVALDAGFLSELRELLGGDGGVPRVFVKGRYLGGAEEVAGLNEVGRLGRIFNWAGVERGIGRLGCGGCGGARFVPC
ncbi:hypothetical protein M569_16922, partial [Genlisea aurea]